MEQCVFCKVSRGELPSYTVYESEIAFAFLDLQPCVEGHTMIIPKHHATTLLDVPREDLGALFFAVQEVAALLKERLQAEGFTIGINHGQASGAVVEHLHIHMIPRYQDDGGGSIHSVVRQDDQAPLDKVLQKIKNQ
jgi:histidine triad (HIT) family protein